MHNLLLANYYLNAYSRYSEDETVSDEFINCIKNNALSTNPFLNELVYVLDIALDHTPTIEISFTKSEEIRGNLYRLKRFFQNGWTKNFRSSKVILGILGEYTLHDLLTLKDKVTQGNFPNERYESIKRSLSMVGLVITVNNNENETIENDIIHKEDEIFVNDIFCLMVESCELLFSINNNTEIIDNNLNDCFNELNLNVQEHGMIEERLRQLFNEYEERYQHSLNKKVVVRNLEIDEIDRYFNEINSINLISFYESCNREFYYNYEDENLLLRQIAINDDFLKEAIFDFDFLNSILLHLRNTSQMENINELNISDLVNIINIKIFQAQNYLNRYKLFPIYFHNGIWECNFPLYNLYDDDQMLLNILNDLIQYGQNSYGETIIHTPRFKLPTQFYSNSELMFKVLSINSQYLFQIDTPNYRSDMSYILKAMICYLSYLDNTSIDPRSVSPALYDFGDFFRNGTDPRDESQLNSNIDDWF